MATTLGELAILVSASTAAFNQQMGGIKGTIAGFAGGLKSSLAPLATVAGLTALVTSAANAADEFRDMSIQTQLSTEFLSRMDYVAKQSGTSIGTVTSAMKRMQMSIGRGLNSKSTTEELAKFGINLQEIARLAPEQQFYKVASAIAAIKNPAQQAAVASKFFGKSWSNMRELLLLGEEGMKSAMQTADDMGLTVTQSQADMADAFNDSMGTMKAALQGMGRTLGLELLDPMTKVASFITGVVTPAVKYFIRGINAIGTSVGGIGAAATQLLTGDVSGALTTYKEVATDVKDIILGEIKPAADAVQTATAQTGAALSGVSADIGDLTDETADEVADMTAEKLREKVTGLAEEAGAAVNSVAGDTVPRALRATSADVSSGMVVTEQKMTNELLSKMVELTTKLLESVNAGGGVAGGGVAIAG